MPNERCYFGCEADVFHTLLYIPPPFNRTPRLCATHSKSWRAYKSSLKRDTRWPEDFWPWADKELETMKQQPVKKCYLGHDGEPAVRVGAQPGDDDAALCGPCAESWTLFAQGCEEQLKTERGFNAAFTEWAAGVHAAASEAVPARDVVVGQWYTLPSGEVERAHALRSEGQDTQAGFIHVDGNLGDPDDIRRLSGNITVIPVAPRRAVATPATASHHEAVQALLESPAEALRAAVEEEPATFSALVHKLSPLFSSESGEWQTDPDTFAWLDGWARSRWGSGFNLDVCASKENALCNAYLTRERSCLDEPLWFGPWYMNPPYGDPEHPCKVPHERCKKKTCEKRGAHVDVYAPGIGDFVLTGRKQAQEGRPGMCLLPFRPDTEWWRLGVLAPDGEQAAVGGDWAQGWSWVRWSSGLLVETRLISGRLSFVRPGGGESWTAPFPSVVVVFDRWK